MKDLYTTQERFLMQAGALQAYDRVLAIVSLRGRPRSAVEVQRQHLIDHLLAFDGNGVLHITEGADSP